MYYVHTGYNIQEKLYRREINDKMLCASRMHLRKEIFKFRDHFQTVTVKKKYFLKNKFVVIINKDIGNKGLYKIFLNAE